MAIIDPWNVPIDINSHEYAIKGNMLKYTITVHELELIQASSTFEIDIKKRLVDGLMQELFKTKCIEFTKSQDVYLGEHYYRARMFVVPDDQVRILRVSQINNTSP
jgi:hypothetical protein